MNLQSSKLKNEWEKERKIGYFLQFLSSQKYITKNKRIMGVRSKLIGQTIEENIDLEK